MQGLRVKDDILNLRGNIFSLDQVHCGGKEHACFPVGNTAWDAEGIQDLANGDTVFLVPPGKFPELVLRQVDDQLLQAGKTLEDELEACQGEGGGLLPILLATILFLFFNVSYIK